MGAGFTSIITVDLSDEKGCSSALSKIDSPRTIEALKILGMDPKELLPVNYQEVVAFLNEREKSIAPKQLV